MEQPVNISTIGGGALEELFQREMEKVVENILDQNMEATTVRKINIEILIKPDAKRNFGQVGISVTSKLAIQNPFGTSLWFGRDGGTARAVEPPQQKPLFPVEKPHNPA